MKVDLADKRILVTGSSGGIGLALVASLIESGARVAAHYHSHHQPVSRLQDAQPTLMYPVKGDLSIPEEVELVYERSVQALGGLDVLVNNAGIALSIAKDDARTTWQEKWDTTLQVNLIAAARLCRLALPLFMGQGTGIVINVSSRAAFRGDTAEYMAYAASKGGMVSLTRSIARAYGKQGITAFTVAPGFVRTNMAKEFTDQYGEDFVVNDIALNQLTTAEDITPIITLLASGMAQHATGATIDINAGSYVH